MIKELIVITATSISPTLSMHTIKNEVTAEAFAERRRMHIVYDYSATNFIGGTMGSGVYKIHFPKKIKVTKILGGRFTIAVKNHPTVTFYPELKNEHEFELRSDVKWENDPHGPSRLWDSTFYSLYWANYELYGFVDVVTK